MQGKLLAWHPIKLEQRLPKEMNTGVLESIVELIKSPREIWTDLSRHRYVIGLLARRDVLLKYRGSYLGIGWSFFYPLLLLLTFSYVFGTVLHAHWPEAAGSKVPFALVMYCGLIPFNVFSEATATAPRIVHGYPNFVKKIVFPLEVLPLVHVVTAMAHGAINLLFLIICLAAIGCLHITVLLVPIVLLPLVLFSLGMAWLLASIGVFFRDLFHVMPVLVQIAMFTSPVFYTVHAVPDSLQWIYLINPLGYVIHTLRQVVLWGHVPELGPLALAVIVSAAFSVFGYRTFMRLKEDFADVI